MSTPLAFGVRGIGAWLAGAPDWPSLRDILLGARGPSVDAPTRPAASILPAAERRRAPDGVRLAAEVASQACAMANADAATLPCVFASIHGELAITDYVCETLARAPLDLSPTRFHNSVLNAPAGYWTIATGCTCASSAVTAHEFSFAAGLLEAATLACAEGTAVLFALCNVASTGPLAEMTRTALAFGTALVLDPATHGVARAHLVLNDGATDHPRPVVLPAVAGDNPANADALALLSALARRQPATLAWPLSPGLSLHMEVVV